MNHNKTYALIMAGGSGTRFWPLSTKKKPKQYLNLVGEQSLLTETLARVAPLSQNQDRFIVTISTQRKLAIAHSQEYMPASNVILEPSARNTAPCVFLSLITLLSKNAHASDMVIILPADHVILNHRGFQDTLQKGVDLAKQTSSIVTIGIIPHTPHTGYGYIKIDKSTSKVLEFKEKPNYETALSYMRDGYFWNAGMFIASVGTLLEEFATNAPAIYAFKDRLLQALQASNEKEIASLYQELPSISIDYAIMENSKRISLVPSEFDWSDLGAWDALIPILRQQQQQQQEQGENFLVHQNERFFFSDAKNNLIKSDPSQLITMIGVNDLIVVNTPSTLLIVKESDAQKIKEVVSYLENQEWGNEYL
ncbi:MAG: NTP transferase domain-containing protein [Oligoflexia bacterium]|nr:NTP transferase domain-containing protein [Oligoflexia bacterium]